jgi:hypothetical protein
MPGDGMCYWLNAVSGMVRFSLLVKIPGKQKHLPERDGGTSSQQSLYKDYNKGQ